MNDMACVATSYMPALVSMSSTVSAPVTLPVMDAAGHFHSVLSVAGTAPPISKGEE